VRVAAEPNEQSILALLSEDPMDETELSREDVSE
jgi:hypothetical protein